MKETYLYRVYSTDKKLFALFVLYLAGIFYYSLKQREEFPFLLYGMYSLVEEKQEAYIAYSVLIAGKEVDYSRLKDAQRELILSPLNHLAELIEQDKITEVELAQFKSWLFRQSVDMRGLESNKMDVYKLTCLYHPDGKPEVVKKELLYSYAAE